MKVTLYKRTVPNMYDVYQGDRRLGLVSKSEDGTWNTLRKGRINSNYWNREEAVRSLVRSAARDKDTAVASEKSNALAIALASIGVVLAIAIVGLVVQAAQKPVAKPVYQSTTILEI